jgi:hypothetical protein
MGEKVNENFGAGLCGHGGTHNINLFTGKGA